MKEDAVAAPWRILAIVATIGIGAPALPDSPPSAKNADPNEVVCEKVGVSGSRVVTRRVCGTRAQWAELRRRERVLANQAQRSTNGTCQAVAMYPMSPGC